MTEIRISREHAETLVTPIKPSSRISREHVEALVTPKKPSSRISREHIETLIVPVKPDSRFSRLHAEVLVSKELWLPLSTRYTEAVKSDDPYLYAKFDSSPGFLVDSSDNSWILTNVGGATQDDLSAFDESVSSLNFNSASGIYVTSNAPANNLLEAAFELWYKGITSNGGRLLGARPVDNSGPSLVLGVGAAPVFGGEPGGVWFGVESDGVWWGIHSDRVKNIADGEWHHIVGSWKGISGSIVSVDQLSIYIDGIKIINPANSTYQSTSAPLSANSGRYWIGRSPQSGSTMAGLIDEVAIYHHELSEDRVLSHYNYAMGFFTGPTVQWQDASGPLPASLLGWWDGAATNPVTALGAWDGTDVQPFN